MKSQISNLKSQILSIFSISLFVFLGASSALASTLSLSPATGTFNRNCPFVIDILLDTKGVATDGTDAYLNFDSSRFNAVSIDTQGKVYPDYPGSEIRNDLGIIKVSGLATPTSPYSGSGKLATINFSVKDTASTGVTQMTFDFDPNDKGKTSDSNVVQKGTATETLDSVLNGSYTIGAGSCGATPAPTQVTPVGAINPPAGAVGAATPSATFIPLKTLPPAGFEKVTYMFAIIGLVLTILGILGLTLL